MKCCRHCFTFFYSQSHGYDAVNSFSKMSPALPSTPTPPSTVLYWQSQCRLCLKWSCLWVIQHTHCTRDVPRLCTVYMELPVKTNSRIFCANFRHKNTENKRNFFTQTVFVTAILPQLGKIITLTSGGKYKRFPEKTNLISFPQVLAYSIIFLTRLWILWLIQASRKSDDPIHKFLTDNESLLLTIRKVFLSQMSYLVQH